MAHPEVSEIADDLRNDLPNLIALRRDIHAHPELGLETFRTAKILSHALTNLGVEVHPFVNGAGLVGVIQGGEGQAAVGLRADLDALPIAEMTTLPHKSTRPGVMHACGHDGHAAMLLGAARHLARTKHFNGRVHLIFQPGEEGAGGALAMLEEQLFERFPCQEIFGLHTLPGAPLGQFEITPGAAMAGGAFFDIRVNGKSAHGAFPHLARDPVVAAAQIVTALQTITARNVVPGSRSVVSVTRVEAGASYNVIPEYAALSGTLRAMTRAELAQLEASTESIACGIANALGMHADVDVRLVFAPLHNAQAPTQTGIRAARDITGGSKVVTDKAPITASEDFAFMLEQIPGAYMNLGNGEHSAPLHNDRFEFCDDGLLYGSAYFARVAELSLARSGQG